MPSTQVAAVCCIARASRTRVCLQHPNPNSGPLALALALPLALPHNKVFLLHRDTMRTCWFKREGRPLLTIANHTSPAELGAMAQLVRPLWCAVLSIEPC